MSTKSKIMSLLNGYLIEYLEINKEQQIKKLPKSLTHVRRKERIQDITENIAYKQIVLKEFFEEFEKDKQVNILAIDQATVKFYQRGFLHAFAIGIALFILLNLLKIFR